jgi:transposase
VSSEKTNGVGPCTDPRSGYSEGVTDAAAPDTDPLSELQKRIETIAVERDTLKSERDQYKHHYVLLLEAYRKLEAGLFAQKRERFVGGPEQLALGLLSMLVSEQAAVAATAAPATATDQQVAAHTRQKPTGRKPLPESMPRVDIEVVPPDVQRQGLDAFDRIGEDVSESVEKRPASYVVVRTVRAKYVPKTEAAEMGNDATRTGPRVLQAPPPERPLPRSIAGPSLLADSIVRRFQDHLPLHRLEGIYEREGLPLARSTICGWHQEVAQLLVPLIIAMWQDAMDAAYLCTDATGVLVQASKKCRRAHFFVVVAPGKHVLFGYSPKHDAKAVDKLLGGYKGYLVADAHSVYNHLYETGDVVEVACWAHARRYFFKALESDGLRARHALSLIQALFLLERGFANAPHTEKLHRRQEEARPIVDAFFEWCDEESLKVLDETPISKAIGYAHNQHQALRRFLEDGRLPIHNNWSEGALRREAVGRKNWLFVGSDEGGNVNAALVTLLASCAMHGLEPLGYLRDLLCLLPSWPVQRVLELAPANWTKTTGSDDVRQKLEANLYRQVALGFLNPTSRAETQAS